MDAVLDLPTGRQVKGVMQMEHYLDTLEQRGISIAAHSLNSTVIIQGEERGKVERRCSVAIVGEC